VEYKKLVEALCNEHQIPIIKVEDNKKLGEWAGLCKIDNTGKSRKVVGCSCVVVRVCILQQVAYYGCHTDFNSDCFVFQDFGPESPALDIVKEYVQTLQAA